MRTIQEIIKTIDEGLLECGKDYMLLGQANKLLANKGIISTAEKSDHLLKKYLLENKIPHAYQVGTKTKQWRIPLSADGKREKKSFKKRQLQNKQYELCTICPKCGINLTIPNEIVNENFIRCLHCGSTFRNPLHNKDNYNISESNKLTKSQRNWIIGIAIAIVLIIVGILSDKDSSSSSTLYYVNTNTYVATSKSSFDEMYRYIIDGDEQALIELIYSGEVKTLIPGTEVYLVSPHMGYSVVRLKGSTQNLWITMEHITQK